MNQISAGRNLGLRMLEGVLVDFKRNAEDRSKCFGFVRVPDEERTVFIHIEGGREWVFDGSADPALQKLNTPAKDDPHAPRKGMIVYLDEIIEVAPKTEGEPPRLRSNTWILGNRTRFRDVLKQIEERAALLAEGDTYRFVIVPYDANEPDELIIETNDLDLLRQRYPKEGMISFPVGDLDDGVAKFLKYDAESDEWVGCEDPR